MNAEEEKNQNYYSNRTLESFNSTTRFMPGGSTARLYQIEMPPIIEIANINLDSGSSTSTPNLLKVPENDITEDFHNQ